MGAVITGQRLLVAGRPVGLDVESGVQLGALRALAVVAAEAQGFDQPQGERVVAVATRMATHLLRYSRSGRIFVRLLERGDHAGVELLATYRGPGTDGTDGMEGRALVEGQGPSGMGGDRTGRRLPRGLGTIARLSDLFDHYSMPGLGMVMMSRLWGGGLAAAAGDRFTIGSMLEPISGEEVSGDAWAVEQDGTRVVALVADGLGHGVAAAAASEAAVTTFRQRHHEPVDDIAKHIHHALRGTRGAAIAVAEIAPDEGRIRFCGIGNIAARLLGAGQERNLTSQFGIAGYQARRIRAYEEPWETGALLVMHSDGLSGSWDLDACPGILSHHPQLVAAAVMRDAPRAVDDALVLVLRDGDKTTGATSQAT